MELLRLEDLQLIGTLGVGGFGSVRLVAAGGRSYALKCLNKNHIVTTGQQEHVLGEKDILMSIHCPFIVRRVADDSISHVGVYSISRHNQTQHL